MLSEIICFTNTMTRFHIPSNLFQATGIVRVRVNPKFYRPTEVEQLLGDCTKAKNTFGWVPKVRYYNNTHII